jgi:tRNA threonylcarbamoyladenosine biosynthesis protein TsaE
MDKTIIARNPAEMEDIGIGIAEGLVNGILVSLVGPLGSGKTTLAKGIAKGLLVTDIVASPSYLLARTYTGRLALHHIDAYRISSLAELAEVGLDAYLPPEDGVSVVEWPERIAGLVELSDVHVRIELLEEDVRRVHVTRREEASHLRVRERP